MLESEKLKLKEIYRATLDGELGASGGCKRDKKHRLYRVFARDARDVGIDLRDTVHSEPRCANAIYLHPASSQKYTEILHHVVGRGKFDDSCTRDFGCSHEYIFYSGVGHFRHHYLGCVHWLC